MDNHEPDNDRLQVAHSQLKSDPQQAVKELEMLAEMGSARAPLYLGWAYRKGDGAPLDPAQAEYWLKVSLARGERLASYYLGHFYADLGRLAEANSAFEQGSKLGCAPSTYCLAMNLLEGVPEPENVLRAKCLLETASSQGHAFALRALASLHLSGQLGVLKIAYGFWLWARAVARGACIAVRSADDDRLRA
jgi:TPR repeat protein